LNTIAESSIIGRLTCCAAGCEGISVGQKGLRVFVVEDETLIRMMVVDMLEGLGHTIAAEAGHLDQAIKLAVSAEFDLAILDVNVDGKFITPVAKLIAARGLPIIFATGYGALGLPEEFNGHAALTKPFEVSVLRSIIDAATASAPPR
jgi:CheY-like chemotaxis protein